MRAVRLFVALIGLFGLSACANMPGLSSSVGGSAGPAGSQSSGTVVLNHCSAPRAVVAIETEQQPGLLVRYGLSSPLPAMRLITQQSNCFHVVNRDVAMKEIQSERALAQSGELRQGSHFGKGQLVAADYTIMVEVLVNQQNAGGIGGVLGGIAGAFIPGGAILGAAASHLQFQDAQVLLTLVNNHTGEQVATASGTNGDTSFGAGVLGGGFGMGGGMLAGAGGYANTDQGKVVMGAMVKALNNLEPQIAALH